MFEISGLCISYGGAEVVHGVTLHVDKGQVVALLGPNGAGKSSILRAVSGLIRPTAGDIVFLGASLVGAPPHEIAAAGISHVMEGRHLFGGLTVEDNLILAGSHDEKGTSGSIEAVYQRWPRLRERRDQLAGTLSGGEQQMLAIGRALMTRPRLLMLDEPSWGLAPLVVRELMQTLRDLQAEGTTILLVEQMAKMALKVCDYGYVMASGRIALEGTSAQLLSNPDLQATYVGGKVGEKLGQPEPLHVPAGGETRPTYPPPTGPIRKRLPAEAQALPSVGSKPGPHASELEFPSQTAEEFGPQTQHEFARRERTRQMAQQSFGSSQSFSELREEVRSLKKQLSTFSPGGTDTGLPTGSSTGGGDWRAREEARQEKAAARQREAPPSSEMQPGRSQPQAHLQAQGLARTQRQTAFERPTTSLRGPEESVWTELERRRQERQESMQAEDRPPETFAQVTKPSAAAKWRENECEREERQKSFQAGRRTEDSTAAQETGPELMDYEVREKARQDRQARHQAGRREPGSES